MNDRYYIGGGVIAAVLGLSPFMSKLEAYLSIIGERTISAEDREFFERRKLWEPYALACFVRATGHKLIHTNERYDDVSFPWAKAEIDAETELANVEVKTVEREVEWMWSDPSVSEAPMYVTAQAAWGIGVRQKELAYIHAFSLSRDRIYTWVRDEETILIVRDKAHRFWHNHVEKRRPPLPEDANDVLLLYGKGTERAVEASAEIKDALTKRDEACKSIKIHEADKLAAEKDIKLFMRDASVLLINGKQVATWKADQRGIRTFRTSRL